MACLPFSMIAEPSCAGRLAGAKAAHKSGILRIAALLLAGTAFGASNLTAQVNFGSAAVGTTTPVTQTVTLTSGIGSNSPVIATISVVTQGAPNLDFTNTGTGTCATGQALNTGETCTVVVNFKPKIAGPRYGAVVLQDSAGWLIASGYLHGTGTGPQMIFSPPTQRYVGHGLNSTSGIVVDGAGAVYVSDPEAHSVIKYTPSGSSFARSVVGGGTDCESIAVDGAGNLFVSHPESDFVEESVPVGGAIIWGKA